MNKNKFLLLLSLFLTVSMLGVVALVKQNQETRKQAAFGSATLKLLPSENPSKKIGDAINLQLWVNTDLKKAEALRSVVCYPKSLVNYNGSSVEESVVPVETLFDKKDVIEREINDTKCLDITLLALNINPPTNSETSFKVADIKLKAIGSGSGSVTLDKSRSQMTAPNPGIADKEVSISSVNNSTFEVNQTNTNALLFKFKVASKLLAPDANCANDWKVMVTVSAPNCANRTYENITLSRDGNIFNGSVRLDGFNCRENVSALIRGPRHLQSKYGRDGQDKQYDKYIGEIALTENETSTKVYNFSKYPLITGDVVKSADTVGMDGVINALDFSYVKKQALKQYTGKPGENLPADLDGNCQYNSRDVNILIQSLSERQGEIY